MGTSGSLITWLHDLFDGDEDFSSSVIDYNRKAECLGPGSDGLVALPYFNGCRTPFKNGKARGVLFGLSMHHTKYHIYRAILESIGYGLRRNLDAMEAKGVNVKRIISSGGGIANTLWVQLMSDITGVDQLCIDLRGYGAPLGNAYMAGMATGLCTIDTCLDFIGRYPTRSIMANPKTTAVYDKYYSVFLGLYQDLEQSFIRLGDVLES
jgi:xylulokinase